jgi:hypothetical protein
MVLVQIMMNNESEHRIHAVTISSLHEHLAGGVKLALIGNNLVNQSGLTFFKVAGTGGIFT